MVLLINDIKNHLIIERSILIGDVFIFDITLSLIKMAFYVL